MYDIPTSIILDEEEYKITDKGDFRMVLDCFKALNDVELSERERLIASTIIFYEDVNSIEDFESLPNLEGTIKEMFKFFNCGMPESPGYQSKHKLIDWEMDSQLICSAINNVAKTEIRSVPYLHWWTFMGYYFSVGESPLSTIVGIRSKILKGKKLEKYEQQFKRENPQYFIWNSKTVEQQEADEWVKNLWNSI